VATKSAKSDDGTSAAIISSYTAKDLSVLEGLDAVRKRQLKFMMMDVVFQLIRNQRLA